MQAEGQPLTTLEKLQLEHKFAIVQDEINKDVRHLVFEDGRQYKFQMPSFFRTYSAVYDSDKAALALLQLGVECLFPENGNTPKVDELYLNERREEAWALWSPLFRGLL